MSLLDDNWPAEGSRGRKAGSGEMFGKCKCSSPAVIIKEKKERIHWKINGKNERIHGNIREEKKSLA